MSTGPIRAFKTQQDFETWLEKNHATSPGIWVRIARKESGKKSLTYQQGVDTALCYGWIDAQKRPESESAWLQRFMPRRPRSIWSRINREKALALIASGRMKRAGLAEVERAKQDGRWEAAYDSASTATVPVDLQNELDRHPRAAEFFKTLDRTNRYAILWRVATAKKAETRARRIAKFIEMLEKGETIH
ncbi:MAG: YdeI/OmpD-associated family protein [Gemmatimonadaceae bacterium]